MKTSFLTVVSVLAGIATSTSAFATGENTVTSKAYVDAMDATKQDIITAKTTGNVVTYNGTSNGQTQFDEVGIYDGSATYSNSDADKLVTAEVVHDFAAAVESITIPDNKLTPVNADGTACSGNNCNLWQISSGTTALTGAGTFNPLTSCLAYGANYATDLSKCCSGVKQQVKDTLCGCRTVSDCPSGYSSCSFKNVCQN